MTYYNDGKRWHTKFVIRELIHTKNLVSRTRVKAASQPQEQINSLLLKRQKWGTATNVLGPTHATYAIGAGLGTLVGITALALLTRSENTDLTRDE